MFVMFGVEIVVKKNKKDPVATLTIFSIIRKKSIFDTDYFAASDSYGFIVLKYRRESHSREMG